jgi:hypothetical protein
VAARLYLFLIGGGGSKFKKFFRLSAAAAWYLELIGGGGWKVQK